MSLSTDPPVITRLPFLVNQFIEAVEDPESGDSPVGHRNTVSGGELPAVSSRVAPQPPANRLDPSRIEDGSKTAPEVAFADSRFFNYCVPQRIGVPRSFWPWVSKIWKWWMPCGRSSVQVQTTFFCGVTSISFVRFAPIP